MAAVTPQTHRAASDGRADRHDLLLMLLLSCFHLFSQVFRYRSEWRAKSPGVMQRHPLPGLMGLLVCTSGPGDRGEASGKFLGHRTAPTRLQMCALPTAGDTVPVHEHPQGWGSRSSCQEGCQGARGHQLKPLQPVLYAEQLINVPDLPESVRVPSADCG